MCRSKLPVALETKGDLQKPRIFRGIDGREGHRDGVGAPRVVIRNPVEDDEDVGGVGVDGAVQGDPIEGDALDLIAGVGFRLYDAPPYDGILNGGEVGGVGQNDVCRGDDDGGVGGIHNVGESDRGAV